MNWIIVGLVIVVVAVYVIWPLRRNVVTDANIEYSISDTSPLDANAALQQLDFDRSMGKIGDDEYRDLRAQLTSISETETAPHSPDDADIEAEILSARARRRKTRDAQIEAQNTSWKCDECGREMRGEDRFCASCGAARVIGTAISSS